MTEKCIDSLLKITKDSKLIIVDNCSPNGSGFVLREKYSEKERISVILNKENQGFAKGNNLGYCFAKETFNPEIIVVMNNDVIIEDEIFEDKIKECFSIKGVDLLGPDIVTLAGNHQNPLAYQPLSSEYISRRIKIDKIKIRFMKWNLFFKMYLAYKRKHPVPIRNEVPAETSDCILHGSCVIYGRLYIEQENFAFLPITYMYNEEQILYDYLKYKGYKTMYSPSISVLHMQGVSTSNRMPDQKEKILFRFEKQTESATKQLIERKKYNGC